MSALGFALAVEHEACSSQVWREDVGSDLTSRFLTVENIKKWVPINWQEAELELETTSQPEPIHYEKASLKQYPTINTYETPMQI
jgi:hypothetical protein